MSDSPPNQEPSNGGTQGWAPPLTHMPTASTPEGATNINVEGSVITGAMKGFGQLWKKTYRVRLAGLDKSPEEVMDDWKHHFPEFQPKQNRFYPSLGEITPGEVLFIDAVLPFGPGMPKVIPVASGVMVMYSDATSFAVTTPQGFPEAGWNNFSVFREDDGTLTAQVQSYGRAHDPLYELGYRFLGGARWQEYIWAHVLESVAGFYGIKTTATMEKICLEPRMQWSEAKNIWHNAMIKTILYRMGGPFRWLKSRLSSPKTNQDQATPDES